MELFHHISTESYAPISHDNSYLFNHYDRVNNFIKTRMDPKFRNILAKPVQRNYNIEWFSIYRDLEKHEKIAGDNSLREYWRFKNALDKYLQTLNATQDEDVKNWIELLNKVFNPDDNIIFSNGKEICLIWGWEFEENNSYSPQLHDEENSPTKELITLGEEPIEDEQIEEKVFEGDKVGEEDDDVIKDNNIVPDIEVKFITFGEEPIEEDVFEGEENEVEDEFPDKSSPYSFLEFLKDFAARYWWLLVVMLVIICTVFLFYSINSFI